MSLIEVIGGMGNSFTNMCEDLMVLDTWEILDPTVASTTKTLESLGKEQSNQFIENFSDLGHKQFYL